jgi:hypothetical protein
MSNAKSTPTVAGKSQEAQRQELAKRIVEKLPPAPSIRVAAHPPSGKGI